MSISSDPKSTHVRVTERCCTLCNYTSWCVPMTDDDTDTGRFVCKDTAECAKHQEWNHEMKVRAELITEIMTMCDDHLLKGWGFVRTESKARWYGDCTECATRP